MTKLPEIETEDDEPDTEGRRMDPELRAMGQMVRTLNSIDERARARVIRWLSDRYPETPPF